MRWRSCLLTGMGLLLCVVGAYLSGQLLIQHLAGQPAGGLVGMLCGQTSAHCDKVLKSRWGVFPPKPASRHTPHEASQNQEHPLDEKEEHAMRIPVAFLGLLYFSFLGAWFLGVGCPNEHGYRWHWLPTVVVLMGNVCSGLFVYVMARELRLWCPACLAVHAINLLLLGTVLAMWCRRIRQRGQERTDTDTPLVPHPTPRLAMVTVVLAVAVCLAEVQTAVAIVRQAQANLLSTLVEDVGKHPDLLAGLFRKQQPKPIALRPDDPTRGDLQDPVATVVVFGDMECLQCRRFEVFLSRQVEPLFQNRLRIVFKHFPICTECNPGVQYNLSPDACEAAYALEAARLQGGNEAFWKMHKELLARQTELGQIDYAAVADELGLDGARLVADMRSDSVRRRVVEDIALAQQLDVKGTPAVFLEGRRVGELPRMKLGFWQQLADELLGSGAQTRPAASAPAP